MESWERLAWFQFVVQMISHGESAFNMMLLKVSGRILWPYLYWCSDAIFLRHRI